MHIPADFLLSTVLYQISFRPSLTVQFPISYHALRTLFPVFCNTFLSVFHYFKVYSDTFHANSISQPHNLISSLRRKWNKKAEAICSAVIPFLYIFWISPASPSTRPFSSIPSLKLHIALTSSRKFPSIGISYSFSMIHNFEWSSVPADALRWHHTVLRCLIEKDCVIYSPLPAFTCQPFFSARVAPPNPAYIASVIP